MSETSKSVFKTVLECISAFVGALLAVIFGVK